MNRNTNRYCRYVLQAGKGVLSAMTLEEVKTTVVGLSKRTQAIKDRFKSVENNNIYACSERTKIMTESYMEHEDEPGILKRAHFFYDICSKMTVRVEEEDELIVGNQGKSYRSVSPYPDWWDARFFESLEKDDEIFRLQWQTPGSHMLMTDEDRAIFRECYPYWKKRSLSARLGKAVPEHAWYLSQSGCLEYARSMPAMGVRPLGHFCSNFYRLVNEGLKSVKEQALAKMAEMEGKVFGNDARRYTFYRSIVIVCDAAILLAKRYSAKCYEVAEIVSDPVRKAELRQMGDQLSHIIEYPCRTYWEALQAVSLYQHMMCIDGQNHGITIGRLDQYVGGFLEKELAEGSITVDFAQELADSWVFKQAELSRADIGEMPEKIVAEDGTVTYKARPGGYGTGQHFTVGGVDKKGKDATNTASYLFIQCYARLFITGPSISIRIHNQTPDDLWMLAVESSKRVGGMPTFENDNIVIPGLIAKGFSLEDARDYCIIGCVEPAGCGNEWPCCGASGAESFWNSPGALVLALHNGVNPLTGKQYGPQTGYLYDYKTFDDLKAAFKTQAEYFMGWHVTCTNFMEMICAEHYPTPITSATMEGCMEKGLDVTWGGAKYNSTGITCLGIGNIADSLTAIRYLCYDNKRYTLKYFYDALCANWVGYDELREVIKNECPHYGNDNDYADEQAIFAMGVFSDFFNEATGPRGKWRPGTFTMTTHILFGSQLAATPDGRADRDPLAEAISPKQGYDKNGPTALMKSAAKLPHIRLLNGDQMNIRFSPATVTGVEGNMKIRQMIQSYFDLGGMQVQFNVVGTETLYDAQKNPDNYKEMIVRIAGFSVVFVEMPKVMQDDFISRTEHSMN